MSKKQRISERIEWEIVSNTAAWVDLDGKVSSGIGNLEVMLFKFLVCFFLKKINSFIWQHQVLTVACRIYFPDQNQTQIPELEHGILSHWTTRELPEVMFLKEVWIEWSGQKSGGSGEEAKTPITGVISRCLTWEVKGVSRETFSSKGESDGHSW